MRIRPYIESMDYIYLERWIENEQVHALWCANLLPFPVTREAFHSFLLKNAKEWADSAYVATEYDGTPTGFFCYSVNPDTNAGFLKLVIVDPKRRGLGYGEKMLRLALQYAFQITGVTLVRLNVFNENIAARRCYEKIGFVTESLENDVFSYQNKRWSRCHMTITKEQVQGGETCDGKTGK